MTDPNAKGMIVAVKMPKQVMDFIKRNPKVAQAVGATLMQFKQADDMRKQINKLKEQFGDETEFQQVFKEAHARYQKAGELHELALKMFLTGETYAPHLENGTLEELREFIKISYDTFMDDKNFTKMGVGNQADFEKVKEELENKYGKDKIIGHEIGFEDKQGSLSVDGKGNLNFNMN